MQSIPTIDGLILAKDLSRLGIDGRSYSRAAASGELTRIHRGVYVSTRSWKEWKPSQRYLHRVLGAARSSPSDLVVSHISSAALWGAPLLAIPRAVHALSDNPFGTRVTNGFHRHATAFADHVVMGPHGVRLTSLARAMVEVASTMPFRNSVVALDWALRPSTAKNPKPTTTKLEILHIAEQLAIVRGRRALERALDFADPDSGSAGESLSRVCVFELGFPPPQLQVSFSDYLGFIGTVDFWWPEHNLIGEFDGVAKYVREEFTAGKTAAQVVIEEKDRENRLRALGPGVTRWDWATAQSANLLFAHLLNAGLPSTRR